MAMHLLQGTIMGSGSGLPEPHLLCWAKDPLLSLVAKILELPIRESPESRYVPRSISFRLIDRAQFAPNATAPRQTVYITREVSVATGALHSAQLSGVGPSSLLAGFDIPVALDLPGVGNNLQDHCLVGTLYPCKLQMDRMLVPMVLMMLADNNTSYTPPTELTTNATYDEEAEEEYDTDKTGM